MIQDTYFRLVANSSPQAIHARDELLLCSAGTKRPLMSTSCNIPSCVPAKCRHVCRKRVAWNFEKNELPDNYCKEDREGLWWSKNDMLARAKTTVAVIKTERSARVYLLSCQQALNAITGERTPAQVNEKDTFLCSAIFAGMERYDYRGMEGIVPPRGERVRAVLKSIVQRSKCRTAASHLSEFAQTKSRKDALWARIMAIGDARAAADLKSSY